MAIPLDDGIFSMDERSNKYSMYLYSSKLARLPGKLHNGMALMHVTTVACSGGSEGPSKGRNPQFQQLAIGQRCFRNCWLASLASGKPLFCHSMCRLSALGGHRC